MGYSKSNDMAELFALNGKLMEILASVDYTKVSKSDMCSLKGSINAAIRQALYAKEQMEARE